MFKTFVYPRFKKTVKVFFEYHVWRGSNNNTKWPLFFWRIELMFWDFILAVHYDIGVYKVLDSFLWSGNTNKHSIWFLHSSQICKCFAFFGPPATWLLGLFLLLATYPSLSSAAEESVYSRFEAISMVIYSIFCWQQFTPLISSNFLCVCKAKWNEETKTKVSFCKLCYLLGFMHDENSGF